MAVRLTQFPDYAIRLLITVALAKGNSVTVADADAAAHVRVSRNHMVKILKPVQAAAGEQAEREQRPWGAGEHMGEKWRLLQKRRSHIGEYVMFRHLHRNSAGGLCRLR